MSNPNRREVVKLAAGLAIGAGVALPGAAAELSWEDLAVAAPADPKALDEQLASAIRSPSTYMFSEQVNVKLVGDGHSRELVITSTRNVEQKSVKVYIRSGTMRIFRADPNVDEFTRQGGVYWHFNGQDGKVQFKRPGAIVMVVRDADDQVRFYTLQHDLRC